MCVSLLLTPPIQRPLFPVHYQFALPAEGAAAAPRGLGAAGNNFRRIASFNNSKKGIGCLGYALRTFN